MRTDWRASATTAGGLYHENNSGGSGEEGEGVWLDALDTIFCRDTVLMDYVQQIVGMAAVGRVYMEALIIAYGEGSNGKSTFWNTIARVPWHL